MIYPMCLCVEKNVGLLRMGEWVSGRVGERGKGMKRSKDGYLEIGNWESGIMGERENERGRMGEWVSRVSCPEIGLQIL